MGIGFYEIMAYIMVIGFEAVIIYDLYRVIKLRNYSVIWLPIIVDIILFILILMVVYLVTNIVSESSEIIYLLIGPAQFFVVAFAFIRVVLIERLKKNK